MYQSIIRASGIASVLLCAAAFAQPTLMSAAESESAVGGGCDYQCYKKKQCPRTSGINCRSGWYFDACAGVSGSSSTCESNSDQPCGSEPQYSPQCALLQGFSGDDCAQRIDLCKEGVVLD